MSQPARRKTPVVAFLFENSLFLILGAAAALLWANLDERSYHRFVDFDVQTIFAPPQKVDEDEDGDEKQHAKADQPEDKEDHQDAAIVHAHSITTIKNLVNDVLMALFFAIAAKEVWESLLPGGALSNFRKAATPLLATAGGVMGPAIIYAAGAVMYGESGWFGQGGDLGRGWAIPCATDIAFSYLVARFVFGPGHPAIAFLLLLAIADDAVGLVILAIFYPSGAISPMWLALTGAAVAIGYMLRILRVQTFWLYLLIPGVLSWISFYMANIHPALGLVPIIPCLPHAHTDLGLFAKEELDRLDTLSEFERWWKNPVQLILGMFGLVNAGVVFSSIGHCTYLVMFGLLIGKPVGITLFTWIAEKLLRLEMPDGMNYRHVVSLGMVAAIGFTVALFVATAAFPVPGPIQDSVKMGALFSFFAAPISIILARCLGVRPLPRNANGLQVSEGAALVRPTSSQPEASARE